MRVELTGATGLLGGAILTALGDSDHQVRTVGRTQVGEDFRAVDFDNSVSVAAALDGTDCVVHAAGKTNSHAADHTNVELARAVGEAAKHQPIIHLSSVAVYGNVSSRPVTELATCQPASPYGRSKLDAEAAIGRSNDRVCHLRIGNVTSPELPTLVVLNRRQRLIRANEVPNFVFAEDVADLVVHLLRSAPAAWPSLINVVRPGLGNVPLRSLLGPVGPWGVPDRFVPSWAPHLLRRLRRVPTLPNAQFSSASITETGFEYRPVCSRSESL